MELVNTNIIPQGFVNSVNKFLSFVDPEKTVLVIGAGSGELLNKFKSNGLQVVCIEENPELCKKWVEQDFEMIQGTFSDLASIKTPKNLAGIWAGAALEHQSAEDFEHNLEVIHLMLPARGALFFTVPRGEGEVRTAGQTTHFYSEEELRKTLTNTNFEIQLIENSTPSVLSAVVTR